MFKRVSIFKKPIPDRSYFLFGPRQTGKTTFLKTEFPEAWFIDLLDARTFRDFSTYPELLRERLDPQQRLIVIDEIQRLPGLLNEVHSLMERNKDLRFILTGSSARSLRSRGVNLLGGRAHVAAGSRSSIRKRDLRTS